MENAGPVGSSDIDEADGDAAAGGSLRDSVPRFPRVLLYLVDFFSLREGRGATRYALGWS